MSLLIQLKADAARLQPDRTSVAHLLKLSLTSGPFSAVLIYRLSHRAGERIPGLGRFLARCNIFVNGIDIDHRAEIGGGALFQHPVGVVIGRDSRIGENTTLMSGVVLGRRDIFKGPDLGMYPHAGDNVFFGTGSTALGPVHIGANAQIAAHALVLNDIPNGVTVVGSPARPTMQFANK